MILKIKLKIKIEKKRKKKKANEPIYFISSNPEIKKNLKSFTI